MKRMLNTVGAASLSVIVSAVAAATMTAAPAQAEPAPIPDIGAAVTSPFDGISVSRKIDSSPDCTYTESATQRKYSCTGIPRNGIGSAVLIHFPDKTSFQAVVALVDGSDPYSRLDWTEQGAEHLPIVTKSGRIDRTQSVTLVGKSVPRRSTGWDLGLDAGVGYRTSQGVDATVIITRRTTPPAPPEPSAPAESVDSGSV